MAYIGLNSQEVDDIVKGLKVLRDRTYNRYHLAKDQQSETAQNNLKRYEELEALRIRVGQEYYRQNQGEASAIGSVVETLR
jgi:hypothetical protein